MFKNSSFETVKKEFSDNKNSHSYIFYTNDFFACQNDLNKLLLEIYNVDNLDKVSTDFIVIKHSENKSILKDDIKVILDLFKTKSYINNKRIYVIEEVHKLNQTTANMILKFLEEPEEGIIAFFITTNLDAVISTIKSRCQIYNVFYDCDNIEKYDNIKILKDFFDGNKYINHFTAKKYFEKYDRNRLIELFNDYLKYCYSNLNNEDNLIYIKKINYVITLLNKNVNIDYIFDYLFLEGGD